MSSGRLQKSVRSSDERGKSIEVRPDDMQGYLRFLEEQVSKSQKRDGQIDKMQTRMIDIQTKYDQILSREAKDGPETSTRNSLVKKLEDRMAAVEKMELRLAQSEKQMTARQTGRLLFLSFREQDYLQSGQPRARSGPVQQPAPRLCTEGGL